ncbi:MFS general substrate transporter [Massarina eburnea CBS 473.64]|uniref:MFS general substrate transporter n=1 Tax=Massarina eburnea CBS 473.64 TaxID=1395130 RepID=A0A6A6RXN7_9PLEO|nr:MFS general substrate transporter [Massarina eburnea CBS 473.64]
MDNEKVDHSNDFNIAEHHSIQPTSTSPSTYTDDDRTVEAQGRNADQMEAGYWFSWRFVGNMMVIGLGFAGGTGGFALIAPVLTDINNELGPSPNILWCPLVYLLCEVIFLLVGRLNDIFGRRWFFISGSFISLIGCIIGAVAQNVNTLIGAEVLIGLASAFQISFFWAISEIVPMK